MIVPRGNLHVGPYLLAAHLLFRYLRKAKGAWTRGLGVWCARHDWFIGDEIV